MILNFGGYMDLFFVNMKDLTNYHIIINLLTFTSSFKNMSRYTHNCNVVWHIFNNHSIGTYHNVVANRNIAQYLCATCHNHVIT